MLAAPAVILTAAGINRLDDRSLTLNENTEKLFHLVIPLNPADLPDGDLEKVAGGDPIDSGQQGGLSPTNKQTFILTKSCPATW